MAGVSICRAPLGPPPAITWDHLLITSMGPTQPQFATGVTD